MTLPDLQTARLRLRAIEAADIEAIVRIDTKPEVATMMRLARVPTADERRAIWTERIRSGWPETGGAWAVRETGAEALLGWCGLFPLHNSDFIEIGYRYDTAAWGRGIATEAAKAVLDHGFQAMGLDPIVAVTDPANRGSQNVLLKLGLERRGEGFHYERMLPFFRLDRDDWLARTGKTAG